VRDIKIRLWHKPTRTMKLMTGLLSFNTKGIIEFNNLFGINITDLYELMLFTGFQDRASKDIFEGDILQWMFGDRPGFKFVVKWDTEEGRYYSAGSAAIPSQWPMCQIVGNIYESPEQLTKVNNFHLEWELQ
jgi:hypothetical protein